MSRRVRRRLNENPLDQWTPATVAAAQANRPRRYGARGISIEMERRGYRPLFASAMGVIYRNQLQRSAEANPNFADYVDGVIGRGVNGNYSDNTNTDTRLDWADYSAARQDWSQVQFLHRFGNVVQTLRQAVARIVRRAKWRRIIKGLRMQRYFEMSRPLAGPSSAVRGPNGLHIQ